MNVAICTPSSGTVKAAYMTSLLGVVMHYLNNPVKGREDEDRFIQYYCQVGSHIAQQRQTLIDDALHNDPTHILFWDDDNGCLPDCLNLALARKKPIVLANYRKKVAPWAFTARRMNGNGGAVEVPTTADSNGLEEVDFGGFGFCLIETDVLKTLRRPFFLTQWIDYQGLYSTEDYPFFRAIQAQGTKVYMDHDISKRISHVGDFTYTYDTSPVPVEHQVAADFSAGKP